MKDQLSEILNLPELYQELAALINGFKLTAEAFKERSLSLEKLFAQYGH